MAKKQRFTVVLQSVEEVEHSDGKTRKGLRYLTLAAASRDEAKTAAQEKESEIRAQVMLAGDDEPPVYKVKEVRKEA